MAKKEIVILTNMCMIYKEDMILVQDRLNPDWPGITFPGGHVELNESFTESTIEKYMKKPNILLMN